MSVLVRKFAVIILAWGLVMVASQGHSQGVPDAGQEPVPLTHSTEDVFIELSGDLEQAVQRGLQYLASIQEPDGSWPSTYGPNTGVAALALLAFISAGHLPGQGPYSQITERGTDFILACADPSGLISNRDGASHGPMYEHALATLYLAEIYGMVDRPGLEGIIHAAVKVIVATQNNEGGWRYQPRVQDADISVTVMQILALRAAYTAGFNVPGETIQKAMEYVRDCAHASGGFTYEARKGEPGYARSAAGVTSLQVAGDYTSREVLTGLEYLLHNLENIDRSVYYGYYYAAQAVYQAKDSRAWERWFPMVKQQLLQLQLEDGAWPPEDAGVSYSTAMALLTLSIPYRYLPIYQR